MSQGKEIKYEEKIHHGNDAKSTEGVSKMVNEFKDIVDYWITLSEPMVLLLQILLSLKPNLYSEHLLQMELISFALHPRTTPKKAENEVN